MNAAPSFFSAGVRCPYFPIAGDLETASAYDLFIVAGFSAAIGWPLPNGNIPVFAANLGVVQVHPEDVEYYRLLCDSERAANPVPRD